jgi:hypothetical protein
MEQKKMETGASAVSRTLQSLHFDPEQLTEGRVDGDSTLNHRWPREEDKVLITLWNSIGLKPHS